MTARRRRIRNYVIALSLALVSLAVAATVYLTSDIRATTSQVAATEVTLPALAQSPRAVTERWKLPTDPATGAVITPGGVVVTTGRTGLVAYRADTAEQVWSYQRSNLSLCAAGTQELPAGAQGDRAGMKGVLAIFAKNGYCSQVVALTSGTGDPYYQRTSPGPIPGHLVFGGPYASWFGPDLVELWRFDLYRTVQYGKQPSSPEANSVRQDCAISDVMLSDSQFAVLQRCPQTSGSNLRLALRWADPHSKGTELKKGWSVFRSDARLEVDTGATEARLVGLTAERAAILVAQPRPAIVVYGASGEISRTPVDITASDIAAAPGQSLQTGTLRLTQVGGTLVATEVRTVTVPATPTSSPAPALGGVTTSSSLAPNTGADTKVDEPYLAWTRTDALGLPGATATALYLPVTGGIAVISRSEGTNQLVLPVDRGRYTGPVTVGVSGPMLIEIRTDHLVGLAAKE